MKRSKTNTSYRNYFQTKFTRYSLGIISAMFGMFVLLLLCSVLFVTVQETNRKSENISLLLEGVFTQMEQDISAASQSPMVRRALQGEAAALYPSNVLLYDLVNRQKIQFSFALLSPTGNVVLSNLYTGNQERLETSERLQEIIQNAKEAPHRIRYESGDMGFHFDQAGVCTMVSAVTDEKGEILGYLLCDLKESALQIALVQYNLDHMTLTDRFDNILFSTYKPMVDPMEKYPAGKLRLNWQNRFTALQGTNEYYVSMRPTQHGQFQTYALTSIDFQKQLFTYGSLVLLSFCFLAIFISHHLVNGFTRLTMDSIDKLVAAAQKIGNGELEYRVEDHNFDEFQALNNAFNILSENLQIMILNNNELAEHKRVLALKQMESQFNPHFMFNTLETIRYKAILEPAVAENMIFRLAKLMRYTMHFGSNQVPLRTDVQFLQDYLHLQKLRFGERLSYTIDVEEALLDMEFPKLLLQPIVENCLQHSTQHTRHVTISITGHLLEDAVILTVWDNGDGISAQKLEELRNDLQDEGNAEKHFGLYSVHRTLALVYGDAYGITIESSPHAGTKVSVTMPPQKEVYHV